MEQRLIQLPFSGFYDMHGQEVDNWIESEASYLQEEHNATQEQTDHLVQVFYDSINFRKFYQLYSKGYVESFKQRFELDSLSFDSLESPKEYNFSTDRIFCNISIQDIYTILAKVGAEKVQALATKWFTSHDDFFISRYDSDIDTWGNVSTWDHNQLACLLHCYCEEMEQQDIDWVLELDLMEDYACNGSIEGWISEADETGVFFDTFNKLTQ